MYLILNSHTLPRSRAAFDRISHFFPLAGAALAGGKRYLWTVGIAELGDDMGFYCSGRHCAGAEAIDKGAGLGADESKAGRCCSARGDEIAGLLECLDSPLGQGAKVACCALGAQDSLADEELLERRDVGACGAARERTGDGGAACLRSQGGGGGGAREQEY